MMRVKLLIGAVAIAAVLGGAVAHVAAALPRNDAMKEMGKNMKAIKDIVTAGGPAADVSVPAQKIAEIAAKIPDLFPQGSDAADDEAKADIWQNWDDFTTKAKGLQNEAGMLASAAGGGDIATVGAQFEKVGGACGACHKVYREKKD